MIAARKVKPNYVGSLLALLSLGAVWYLLGSLSRITSLTAPLDGKGASVAATTWISKKCRAAPTPLDLSKLGKKTVLVTGAASLIGYHLTIYCAEVLGMKVIAVDEYMPTPPQSTNSTRYVKGNLQDESFVMDLFSWYQFDIVYHMAEYGSSDTSTYLPASNYKANLIAAVHVLNGAIRTHVKKFVYLSSIAVYGSPGPLYTESVSPDPLDPFGIAKAAMEKQVQLAASHYGFKYVIIRAGPLFGPGAQMTSSVSPFTALIVQAKTGKALIVPRAEHQLLEASYVKDVAPMVAESALLKGAANQIINMGTDREVTYAEATELLADAVGGDISIGYSRPQGAVAQKRMRASYTKMHCMFGEREETPLAEAVNATVAWLATRSEELTPKQPNVQLELTALRPTVAAATAGAVGTVAA